MVPLLREECSPRFSSPEKYPVFPNKNRDYRSPNPSIFSSQRSASAMKGSNVDEAFCRTTNSITIERSPRNEEGGGGEGGKIVAFLSGPFISFATIYSRGRYTKSKIHFYLIVNAYRPPLIEGEGENEFRDRLCTKGRAICFCWGGEARFNVCPWKSRNNNSTWIRARGNALTNSNRSRFRELPANPNKCFLDTVLLISRVIL